MADETYRGLLENISEASGTYKQMLQAIAAGGGGMLVANMDPNTGELDKTWQEIYDAPFCIIKINDNAVFSFVINKIAEYYLSAYAFDGENMQFLAFATNAADGYPSLQEPG